MDENALVDENAPVVGNAPVPDDGQFYAAVREHTDVRARAAALGLDWDALRSARTRLLLGAWLISIALALLALAQPVGALIQHELTAPDGWNPRGFVIVIIAGGLSAYFARLASMFVARRLSSSPLRGDDVAREITVGTAAQSTLFPLLTLVACFFAGGESIWLLGVGVGAPLAAIVEIRALTHFPIFLAQNSTFIGPVFTRMRVSSPLESLRGLRVRWILVRHLGIALFALGTSFLIATNGWFVLPLIAVGLILEFAAVRLSLAGHPIGSALVQLLLGVLTFCAAAILYLTPLLGVAGPANA